MMAFEHGEQLKAICFIDGSAMNVGEDCDAIIVSMESGQMADVAWFDVWKDEKIISKWNAAKVEGVLY